MSSEDPTPRIRRVRHETRRRTLTVKRRTVLSPSLVRLTLTGDDLAGFTSLGFDDHIKLFFPAADGEAAMRDYTPRRYDAAASELDIEFARHDLAGPATAWAEAADVGSTLAIGGPRGSFVIEDSFDWYILVGDETALPAIGRRLEELRPGVPAHVIAEVGGAADEIAFSTKADLHLQWIHRAAGGDVVAAARALGLPAGEGHVWVGTETDVAKALRGVFVDELGQPGDLIRASAYWRRGSADAHEVPGGNSASPLS